MSVGAAEPDAGAGRSPASERLVGGALLVAVAACCFGSISTLTVIATRGTPGQPGASLVGVLFWRYVLAACALAPLALSGARPRRWRADRGLLAPLLVGGLGQAGVAFLSLSALRWITVGTLGFLFYTYPAWVALLAAVRGSEPLDRRKLVALALSLAGIACTIGLPGATAGSGAAGAPVIAGGAWPGVLLALAGAGVYALYIPYLGTLQARLTPVGASAVVCAGAAVLFAGPALYGAAAGGTPLLRLPVAAWLAIAALVLLCTVLAFIAFLSGLARLGPVRAAIVSTVEPFFTAVLGAVALGQSAGIGTYVGGALIALAVLLLRRPGARDAS